MPRVKAHERKITDACRLHKGDRQAATEAVESARDVIEELLDTWPVGKEAFVRVIVEVEYSGG